MFKNVKAYKFNKKKCHYVISPHITSLLDEISSNIVPFWLKL